MHDNRYSRHYIHDLTEIPSENGTPEDEDEVFLRRHSGQIKSPVDPYLSEDEQKVMRRATIVLMYVVWFSCACLHIDPCCKIPNYSDTRKIAISIQNF